MPRLIKCPSCATQMDVGEAQPGTVVGCPGCQVKIRIPTGKTGKHPAVGTGGATPAPAPAPQVAPARSSATGSSSRVRRRAGSGITTKTRTATRLRGKGGDRGGEEEDGEGGYAPPEKKSKTGLIVGIVVGAVVLVGLIIIIVVSNKPKNTGPIARHDDNAPAAKQPIIPPNTNSPGTNPSSPKIPDTTGTTGEGEDKLREKLRGGAVKGRGRWDLIMDGLKMFGSKGYDSGFYEFEQEVDPSCTQAWNSVKRMGTTAYPYLLVYLLDEDPQRMRGAAAALWTLAQKQGRMPKPGNAAAMQSELKGLLQVSDDSLKAAEAELKGGG